ncbi:FkbM family methyltransferase [Nocardioides sp. TF02-7]|uniref:FkbM family methyltransferase n=1 Tax=Nocardioides sp. TF02-7 TaxID=2917724 RepID=UPI001F0677EF|nr:FkbM family methyltransferase [Nocardioides sp. TF02-7]UMG91127.1 FkbM family methyltransferase [Nocardioides sp. TF02-7]
MVCVHHALVDGRGIAQVGLLLGDILAGREPAEHPLFAPTVSQEDVLAATADPRQRRRELLALARTVRDEEEYAGNADRLPWHRPAVDGPRDVEFHLLRLDRDATAGLLAHARANGTTVHGLLAAAALGTCAELSPGVRRLAVSTPVDLKGPHGIGPEVPVGQAAGLIAGSYDVTVPELELARAVTGDIRRRVARGEGDLAYALSGAERLVVGPQSDAAVARWTADAPPRRVHQQRRRRARAGAGRRTWPAAQPGAGAQPGAVHRRHHAPRRARAGPLLRPQPARRRAGRPDRRDPRPARPRRGRPAGDRVVIELLRRVAATDPDRPAVVAADGTHTYGDLAAAAEAYAAGLRSAGVERFVVVTNDVPLIVALLAASSLVGAEACTYAPDVTPDDLARQGRGARPHRGRHRPRRPRRRRPGRAPAGGAARHRRAGRRAAPAPAAAGADHRHDRPPPRRTPRLGPPAHRASRLADGAGQRWLLVYGPQQYAGLQILLHVLGSGATLVAPPVRRPQAVLDDLHRHRVDHISATPTFWRFLLAELTADGRPVPPLRQVTLGGEAAPASLLADLEATFPGARISHVYAGSEFGSTGSVSDRRNGLPASLLERGDDGEVTLKIVDGQLWVRSSASMLGYYGEDDLPADAWWPTGDLVEVVGDRIEFRGRDSDVINVGGVKVHPLPVEERLARLPGVRAARVYGRANPLVGAVVAVDVVAEPAVDPAGLRTAVKEACADLPRPAQPAACGSSRPWRREAARPCEVSVPTSSARVPALREAVSTVRRRAGWFVRDRFPRRVVAREVQGVRMVLPWAHRLPDYAGPGSAYGQNLVRLARLLAEEAPPLTMLDVGANVGDSTLQVLDAADGTVLCVEADTYYLDFLHRNVDGDPRVTVVESLLALEETAARTTAVRTGGTTRFVEGGDADAMPSVTPARLRAEHPAFADLRLVKSDTDGYDVALVPAIAEAWRDSRPVLFFEYDPYLTRIAGYDPLEVWDRLADLGYHQAGVWDNGGADVGRMTGAEVAARSGELDDFPRNRPGRRSYWDVAVVHDDDPAGLAVLDRLLPAAGG